MTNEEYLKALIEELMADEEWEFPQELRFILTADLPWKLLGL